jgi:hypothetical protein
MESNIYTWATLAKVAVVPTDSLPALAAAIVRGLLLLSLNTPNNFDQESDVQVRRVDVVPGNYSRSSNALCDSRRREKIVHEVIRHRSARARSISISGSQRWTLTSDNSPSKFSASLSPRSTHWHALPLFFVRLACAYKIASFVAILSINLFHHAIDVVLDGELGQIEICRDLLVA